MPKVFRVGLDIDDVITDFWTTASPIFNRKYGGSASKADFITYDAMNSIYDISYEEFKRTIIEECIFEQMQPYPGVCETIEKFKSDGAIIDLITSRGFHPNARALTLDYLNRHNVIFDELYIKEEGKKKSDYITDQLDLYVDDLPANLHDIKGSLKAKNLALIHQPWNVTETGFDRYNHLKEVYVAFSKKRRPEAASLTV